MSAVSLSSLEARVRRLADIENKLTRHPQADVWDDINRGIKHFHAEVVRARGQGLFEATAIITTVSGQENYNLPAAMLDVVKVWTFIGGTERVMRSYEEQDTDGMGSEALAWSIWNGPSQWRIVGSTISLRQTPGGTYTVYVKYIATLVELTSGSDTLEGFDGFDEFVVAWAARRAAMKDNKLELVGAFSNDIAETVDRLRATVRRRNSASAERMVDTRRNAMVKFYGPAITRRWWW